MRVLVYGATGAQGGPVVRRLREQGADVRALTRDPAHAVPLEPLGVEVATGDLGDLASLERASVGADAAFLHLPVSGDPARRPEYLANALRAAHTAAVGLVVFSTSSGAYTDGPSGVGMFEGQRAVLAALASPPVPVVVLRPTVYLDSLASVAGAVHGAGVLPWAYPAGEPVNWVSLEDHGAAAAAVVARPDLAGRVLEVAGPGAVTGSELAGQVSTALGRGVAYVEQTPEQLQEQLLNLVGPDVAREVAAVYRWHWEHGTGPVATRTSPALLDAGFRPTPREDSLRALFAAAAAQPAGSGS